MRSQKLRFPFQPLTNRTVNNHRSRIHSYSRIRFPAYNSERSSILLVVINYHPTAIFLVRNSSVTHTHIYTRSFLTSVIAFVRFSREIRTNQRFYRRCSLFAVRIKYERVKCLKKSGTVKRYISSSGVLYILFRIFNFLNFFKQTFKKDIFKIARNIPIANQSG